MNRYRTIPGLGQPKASATTTCQKCLKKDKSNLRRRENESLILKLRHYSYECKATTQDRPYISRPSRTQQLFNPKLKPKLTSDAGNGLTRTQGVADEVLANAQAAREAISQNPTVRRPQSPDPPLSPSRRQRSTSVASSHSVSTISTSRSRSPPPKRRMSPDLVARGRDLEARSRSESRSRKRKYRESSFSRSPPRFDSTHKNRRYRSGSPEDRGRPPNDRRGSHRSRSRSASADRSEITKQRRSLDEVEATSSMNSRNQRQSERYDNHQNRQPPFRKERSLSPYSRRLALTQAMNMNR